MSLVRMPPTRDEIDGEDETLGLRSGQPTDQRGPLCSYVAATALLLLGCGVGLGIGALLSLLFPASSLRFISTNASPDALADAQSQLSFLVVGDWGRNGDYNQSIVAESMGEVAAAIDSSFVVASTGDTFYDDGMQDIVQYSSFVVSTGDNFYDDGLQDINDPNFASSFSEIYQAPSLQTQWYAGTPSRFSSCSPAAGSCWATMTSTATPTPAVTHSRPTSPFHPAIAPPIPPVFLPPAVLGNHDYHRNPDAQTDPALTPHPPPPPPFRPTSSSPLITVRPPAVLGNHDYHRNPDAETDPALRRRDPRWRCEKTYTVVRDTCPKFRYCELWKGCRACPKALRSQSPSLPVSPLPSCPRCPHQMALSVECNPLLQLFFIDTSPLVAGYWHGKPHEFEKLNFTGLPDASLTLHYQLTVTIFETSQKPPPSPCTTNQLTVLSASYSPLLTSSCPISYALLGHLNILPLQLLVACLSSILPAPANLPASRMPVAPSPTCPALRPPQLLRAALASSTAAWKVVVGHHPIHSTGSHGNTPELIKFLYPLLKFVSAPPLRAPLPSRRA
ncbi:unnamed protein product [Closterium sp. NIES-64]|nr:unnamed protein product [Closterium sp. NIES-64]